MRIRSFVIIFSVICLLGNSNSSQTTQEISKTFSVQQLQEDFQVFRAALEEGHAGLYRYTPKPELDPQFDAVLKNLSQPMAEIDFYRQLVPIIASINDGHTSIRLSSKLETYLNDQAFLFPFNLRFLHKKAYLFRNYSDNPDLPLGVEITSINGLQVADILDQMLPQIPSDAHIETSKFKKLERTEYFGSLLSLLFGGTETFAITYLTTDTDKIQKAQVSAIKPKDLTRFYSQRYPEAEENKPPIDLIYNDNIAILTIRTFGDGPYRKAEISYPKFIKETFQALIDKNIKYLIIDLRDNGGGRDDFGKMLFAHMIDHKYRYYEALEIKKNQYDFFAHTNIPVKDREISPHMIRKNERGWYDQLGHPNLGEQKPIPPLYTGKIYILINGGSFSATGESTSLIHYYKKAIFIGEECGAGYYGNTSGFVPTLILPNTKIRANIPLVRYTMAVADYPKDRGIIPEHKVTPTIADLLAGKDTVMDYALDLIKNQDKT